MVKVVVLCCLNRSLILVLFNFKLLLKLINSGQGGTRQVEVFTQTVNDSHHNQLISTPTLRPILVLTESLPVKLVKMAAMIEINQRWGINYHTESRCQHQPASFSSAFKLSGTACLVGWGRGVSSPDWGHVLKLITLCSTRHAPHRAIEVNLTPTVGE